MKGQFLVISSIVISAILLGTATTVAELRSDDISTSGMDREVQNVKDIVNSVNLSERSQRSALIEVLRREDFRTRTSYDADQNCMNITLIDTNSRFRLGCVEGASADTGFGALVLEILADADFEQYGRYESTSVDRTLDPGSVGLGYRSGERSITGLQDGLIGYWRFERANGPFKDYSQYSNQAVPDKTFRQGNGVFSTNSVTQDSGNGVLEVTEDRVHPNKTITVSLWARVDNYPNNYVAFADADYTRRWYLGTDNSGQTYRFMISFDNTAYGYNYTNVGSFNENEWNHVAFTYDYNYNSGSAANMTMYKNGEIIESHDMSSECGTPGSDDCEIENVRRSLCFMNSEPCLQLGINNPNPLQGSVDEARIYDRALTPSEMHKLYLMGRDGTFDGSYSAESLGISGEEIEEIEVDASIPNSDTRATMTVEDSGGPIQSFNLDDGTRNYTLGGYNARSTTKLVFDLESDSKTLSPVIDDIRFWRSN